MQRPFSLTFRLTLMFSLSAVSVLLLLGFVVLYAVNQHFITQDKMMLDAQSHHVKQRLIHVHDANELAAHFTSVADNTMPNQHGFSLRLLDQQGTILFSTLDPYLNKPQPSLFSSVTTPTLTTEQVAENSYRLLSEPVLIAGEPALLSIALDINHHQLFLRAFRMLMWLSITAAALLMGLFAWAVAKRGLAPLHTLMQQTAQITVNNLAERLPDNQSYAEIARLTATFNAMLDRLHLGFKRLTHFSSDLAHEMRTPLSSLKMQNQVMLSRPRSVDEYQQALQDNAESLDQLIRMVTDMLFLAKSDNGLITPHAHPFALHEELSTLTDFYSYLAQEKGMRLQISGEALIYGDKPLLRRALSNLITNAIHYGDANTEITISLLAQQHAVTITVENVGDTLSADHLPHLFARFYRVDSARTHSSEGAGLGLAITAAIVEAHSGTIAVESSNRITRFSLTLPPTPQ